jgi:YgiT-type zinc finger domain-containing protein
MKCTIVECPGTYETRETVVVERVQGQLMVIEHVPVEVCDVCGDVLFRPETIRHLEALRHTAAPPTRTVPLYEYV